MRKVGTAIDPNVSWHITIEDALSPRNPMIVERLAANRAREGTAATEVESLERQLNISRREIAPGMLDAFEAALKVKLRNGDADSLRNMFP